MYGSIDYASDEIVQTSICLTPIFRWNIIMVCDIAFGKPKSIFPPTASDELCPSTHRIHGRRGECLHVGSDRRACCCCVRGMKTYKHISSASADREWGPRECLVYDSWELLQRSTTHRTWHWNWKLGWLDLRSRRMFFIMYCTPCYWNWHIFVWGLTVINSYHSNSIWLIQLNDIG